MKKLITSFLLLSALAVTFNACKKDDPPLPPNTVTFQAATVGLEAAQTEATVTLSLSRAESANVSVKLNFAATGLIYGTDFTTTPAPTGTELTVVVPAGSTSATFKVTKTSAILLSGSESVKFTIVDPGTGLTAGTTKETVVSFGLIVSEGSTEFVLPGKTTSSNYGNTVFADLSNNAVVAVDRKSWNIGLQSGASFRVILNQAYQSAAKATAKSDIAAVTVADAEGVDLDFGPGGGSLSYVDDWTGDLSKTAIAEVSATAGDNKVYLLTNEANRTDRSQWFKLKVTRNGEGYKVEYARLSETTIRTIDVPKASAYNFAFVSLETNAIVPVELRAASWDIAWSYSTYNSGLNTPYWFQDFILLNSVGGAEAAEIKFTKEDGVTPVDNATAVTEAAFNSFSEANLAGLSFSKARDAIGSKWRSTSTGIFRYKFYIVKDASGNYYKLRFSRMGVGDTGERGRPEIEFKLLKKA